jgi:hypothetical protein
LNNHNNFIFKNITNEDLLERGELIEELEKSGFKDDYIYRMFREIYICYLLHLDFVVAKTLPAFMDTLLISLLAGKKIRYKQEYNNVRGKIEGMYSKDLLKECKDLKMLNDDELKLFSSVANNENPLNRNYEYHGKEYTKSKKKKMMTGDKEAEDSVKKMVTQNPNYRYVFNYQAISDSLKYYIVNLYNFMVSRSKDLHKECNIPDKKVYDVLGDDFDVESIIKSIHK